MSENARGVSYFVRDKIVVSLEHLSAFSINLFF